jgi:hypothetical protein
VKPTPLPANLTQLCARIESPKLNDLGDLLNAHVELIYLYGECAARHRALVEATKK